MKNTVWTEEFEDELRQQWGNSSLTATQIGKMLGCTRNAVIGKANRMGLEPRAPRATLRGVGTYARFPHSHRQSAP